MHLLEERVFQDAPRRYFTFPEICPIAWDTARTEQARNRAAQEDARRFAEKMENFVQAWNSLAAEIAERRTFNIKKARAVTQAWRKLESESAWPKK